MPRLLRFRHMWAAVAVAMIAFTLGWSSSSITHGDDGAKKTAQSLDSLRWMAGTWLSDTNGTIVEEQWLAPRGGLMIGVNRTVPAKGKTQFEFLRIEEKDGVLTLLASPSGAPATPFRASTVTPERVTFENPENDFPHKVEYWRENDMMRAKIEGPIQGKTRSIEWTWKRAQ